VKKKKHGAVQERKNFHNVGHDDSGSTLPDEEQRHQVGSRTVGGKRVITRKNRRKKGDT